MPTMTVNGVELSYVEHGLGPEPLVLLHGFLTSARLWEALYFPRLPQKYRAYALDLRGHGRSRGVTRGCTLAQMSDDVRQFAARLGLKKYAAIGVSMGAGVALQVALDEPAALKALVLINSLSPFDPIGTPWRRFLARWLAGRRWLLRRACRPMFTQDRGPLLEAFLDEAMLVRRETARDWLSGENGMRHLARLGALRVPTLVIVSGRNTVVPIASQIRLAKSIPNARIVTFPDEGHAVSGENPERVLSEVLTFLEDAGQVVPARRQ